MPIALFFRGPFVVLLLAFRESDIEFRAALGPVQIERHERKTLAFDRSDEPVEFVSVQEQLAGSSGVRADVARCRG